MVRRTTTHTVSGASLSLFSSRYLTSEIRRQPALLNSVERWSGKGMSRGGIKLGRKRVASRTCLAQA